MTRNHRSPCGSRRHVSYTELSQSRRRILPTRHQYCPSSHLAAHRISDLLSSQIYSPALSSKRLTVDSDCFNDRNDNSLLELQSTIDFRPNFKITWLI
jgi:hypothetical protein